MQEKTGSFTGTLRLGVPTHLHDFTLSGNLDIRPSARGSVVENGIVYGGMHRPNTVGVFATDVTLSHLNVTNSHSAIGIQLGWEHDVADRVRVEDVNVHDVGRLPATNHDHGLYVEQCANGVFRRLTVSGCADRGVQFYPGARNCLLENFVIEGCGEGIIFGGGDEGLGYQYPKANIVRNGTLCNSLIRYLLESDSMKPDAANVVQTVTMYGGKKGSVMPGLVGVRVVQ